MNNYTAQELYENQPSALARITFLQSQPGILNPRLLTVRKIQVADLRSASNQQKAKSIWEDPNAPIYVVQFEG